MLARQLHVVLMLDTAVSSALATEADRMAFWRGSVAAAEARKTDGASMHALLIPSPPCEPSVMLVSTVYHCVLLLLLLLLYRF